MSEIPDSGNKPAPVLIDGQWLPGMWGEYPTITCAMCKWDTLEGIEAAREYKQNCPRCHPPEVRPEPPIVFVADRYGNPISVPIQREE